MAEKLRRPAPFTPLSVTFATGKTGTTILTEFGAEGLGVWAAMLAAAKHEEGLIVFKHDADWGAIGMGIRPPKLKLKELLRRLGQLKQTRTTRQGQVLYVELTRWNDWNKTKERAESSWRKSRSREHAKRDMNRDKSVTPTGTAAGQERDSRAREDPEPELELDSPPSPPKGESVISQKELRRYTGCRLTHGSHGNSYVRDPLGTDKPPSDWPHKPPSVDEVLAAKAEPTLGLNGTAAFDYAECYVEQTGWQDPHLEDELRERWPELEPAELTDLLNTAAQIVKRMKEVA